MLTFITVDDQGPWYLWCRLCRDPHCQCTDALVLATREAPDLIAPIAARVEAAYVSGDPHQRAVALAGGALTALGLDVSTGLPHPLRGGTLTEAGERAAASLRPRQVEELHRRWRQLKRVPDERKPLELDDPYLADWKPGDLLDWDLVYPDDTFETLLHDGRWLHPVESYCVTPSCTCGTMELRIEVLGDEPTSEPLAQASLDLASGARPIATNPGEQPLIDAWLARNPDWLDRSRQRQSILRPLGVVLAARVQAARPARVKVGRNEACPCGSGKKFKRCCGA